MEECLRQVYNTTENFVSTWNSVGLVNLSTGHKYLASAWKAQVALSVLCLSWLKASLINVYTLGLVSFVEVMGMAINRLIRKVSRICSWYGLLGSHVVRVKVLLQSQNSYELYKVFNEYVGG